LNQTNAKMGWACDRDDRLRDLLRKP